MTKELATLWHERNEIDREIGALKRERADLSVRITELWQKDPIETEHSLQNEEKTKSVAQGRTPKSS